MTGMRKILIEAREQLCLLICCCVTFITGKNPTYAQAIIKVFVHNTVHCVKLLLHCVVAVFAVYE